MKKKVICLILTLVFLCGLAFSAYQIYKQLHEYDEGKNAYDDLDEYIDLPLPDETEDLSEENQSESEEKEDIVWPQVDFDELKKINGDIVGWIYLEGSKINYPIVQSEDNSY